MSFTSDTHSNSSYPTSPGSNVSSGGSGPGTSRSDDPSSLRADLDALKEQLTAFVAKAGSDAMSTARAATADVANQMGNKATELANTASEQARNLANAAAEQAKTLTSELERVGRNNPLGTIAGALLVGVVIGLLGRRH